MGAGTLAGVGWAELTREGAELRALEHFEAHGLLPKQLKNQLGYQARSGKNFAIG